MQYWLPDWLYDLIKWGVTVLLPAVTALFVALAAIWGWPMADQIKDTLVAAYTFLCALMGISGAVGVLRRDE